MPDVSIIRKSEENPRWAEVEDTGPAWGRYMTKASRSVSYIVAGRADLGLVFITFSWLSIERRVRMKDPPRAITSNVHLATLESLQNHPTLQNLQSNQRWLYTIRTQYRQYWE